MINVALTDGKQDILLTSHNGMCIRFNETDARPLGRVSHGVRGIRLSSESDYVVGMGVVQPDADLLVVTENGYGKKTALSEYKTQNRGGQGVNTYRISEATGKIAGIMVVTEADDIMLITSDGTIIRMKTREISQLGRLTKGVRLMRLDDVQVVSVARTDEEEEKEASELTEETVAEEAVDTEE